MNALGLPSAFIFAIYSLQRGYNSKNSRIDAKINVNNMQNKTKFLDNHIIISYNKLILYTRKGNFNEQEFLELKKENSIRGHH